jgi:hypothetical protein
MKETDNERREGDERDEAAAEPLRDEVLKEVAGGVAVRLPIDPPGFHYRPLKTGYEHPSRKQ